MEVLSAMNRTDVTGEEHTFAAPLTSLFGETSTVREDALLARRREAEGHKGQTAAPHGFHDRPSRKVHLSGDGALEGFGRVLSRVHVVARWITGSGRRGTIK